MDTESVDRRTDKRLPAVSLEGSSLVFIVECDPYPLASVIASESLRANSRW